MEKYNLNAFNEISEKELVETDGGNPVTILKWGYKIIKTVYKYKNDIASGLVDGWNAG
ncbi:MAG: hypothetical protein IJY19_07255 [Ruminococcus sp.]|nr:hypothetical protein [Ruminococcus sp.]